MSNADPQMSSTRLCMDMNMYIYIRVCCMSIGWSCGTRGCCQFDFKAWALKWVVLDMIALC